MFIPQWFHPFARILYPLPTSTSEPARKVEVLALGLPRSGTDSLRKALMILGYPKVSHGFVWWCERPEISESLYLLGRSIPTKTTIGLDPARKETLDRAFGDFNALTDVPAAWFANELLLAYPNAKVVLNRRRNVHAWKKSFRGSVLPMMQSWSYWFWSWFHAELFWGMLLTYELHNQALIQGDFEKNAEKAYLHHYEKLEATLRSQGRQWLDWGVEDGWQPLCEFLDKPCPSEEFPYGNATAEFAPKLMQTDASRFQKAKLNAAVIGLLSTIALISFYRWI